MNSLMNSNEKSLSDKFDQMPTDQLEQLMENSSILNRVHAIAALSRRSSQSRDLVSKIIAAIIDPKNRNDKLMGTISVAHLGIASLLRSDKPEYVEAANQLIEEWQGVDREDLIWYLKSESLLAVQEAKPSNVLT
jgi:hypothetical protein